MRAQAQGHTHAEDSDFILYGEENESGEKKPIKNVWRFTGVVKEREGPADKRDMFVCNRHD